MPKRTKKPPKPPDKNITFGATIEDTVVPDHVVLSRSKLLPVSRKMDRMYGAGRWGDTELRQYICQQEWKKRQKYQQYLVEQQQTGPTPVAGVTADERVASLMQQFPELTATHLPMVQQLVAFERGLARLTVQFDEAVDHKDMAKVRKLQQAMTDLQREIRQMTQQLRIDVGSLRGEGTAEIRQEVMALMDRAQALLQKHAVRLACPACQEKGIVINLGFLLFHFRDNVNWHFWCVCPHTKCGQGIHVEGGPNRAVTIYNGPEQTRPPKG